MAGKRFWRDMIDRDRDKPILEQLYIKHGVPTDQLRRRPDVLDQITRAFNRLSHASPYSASDLLEYMMNRRKCGDWPKLGKLAQRFKPLRDHLTQLETETLKQIYLELDLTSDAFLYTPKMMLHIAARFHGLTRRKEPGAILVGVIMAHRKRGLWPCIREERGFDDIRDFA